RRESLRLGGRGNDAEAIAQPLHGRAGDEGASLERVADAVPGVPGDGREETTARGGGALAGVREEEAAGPICVLRLTCGEAGLSEERGLLVSGDPGDRYPSAEVHWIGFRDDAAGRHRHRHHRGRDAEQPEQIGIPRSAMDIEHKRSRCVRYVGREDSAAGELPDEPGVDRPAHELAGFGPFLRTGDLIQDPPDFRAGEVRVDHEPGAFADELLMPGRTESFADRRARPALPDDRRVDRATRRAFPYYGRLALVGDPDGGELVRGESRAREGFAPDH